MLFTMWSLINLPFFFKFPNYEVTIISKLYTMLNVRVKIIMGDGGA